MASMATASGTMLASILHHTHAFCFHSAMHFPHVKHQYVKPLSGRLGGRLSINLRGKEIKEQARHAKGGEHKVP